MSKILLIGIAGGPFCGKKEVCKKISSKLSPISNVHCEEVNMRNFYRKLTNEEEALMQQGKYNVDHPQAYDFEKLLNYLEKVKSGIDISETLPSESSNVSCKTTSCQLRVYLLYGVYALFERNLRDLLDMKIFIDVDSDVRLSRRITLESSDTLDSTLNYYIKFGKPSFEDYILPTKKYSDIIIPRGAENLTAIELIVDHIKDMININLAHRFNNLSSTDELSLYQS